MREREEKTGRERNNKLHVAASSSHLKFSVCACTSDHECCTHTRFTLTNTPLKFSENSEIPEFLAKVYFTTACNIVHMLMSQLCHTFTMCSINK